MDSRAAKLILSPEKLAEICSALGIEFLDAEYINAHHAHSFRFLDCGHEVVSSLSNLKRIVRNKNGRCWKCRKEGFSINFVNGICEANNWEMLTKDYTGGRGSYEFRCRICNHVRRCNIYLFAEDPSCFNCSEKKKLVDVCRDNNIELLDEKYEGTYRKYSFLFKKCGHIAEMLPAHVKYRKRCPRCSDTSIGIERVLEHYDILNLHMIDRSEYVNVNSKCRVRCLECGSEFGLRYNTVRMTGSRNCFNCFNERRKIPLGETTSCFADAGFEYLDGYYHNSGYGHTCRCMACGYICRKSLDSIKRGTSCTNCSGFLYERIVKLTSEMMLGCPSEKVRLDCLRNPLTGYSLEIDVFFDNLRLGIEHQGDHHYCLCHVNRFSERTLRKQKERDSIKRKLCRENGIVLIEVPQLYSRTRPVSLVGFLGGHFRANGIAYNPDVDIQKTISRARNMIWQKNQKNR